ncbi:MAG: hypothetical protein EON60_10720 [Alphaproteobacteria bacterium]|nr:MAG: hypothetical protein EON60_10720 [Alphaproteobacteria bacterium]
MQLKILNNQQAMDVLLDIGNYAREERLRLKRLNNIIRNPKVVDLRLYRVVKLIDAMFFQVWYVESLRQRLVSTGHELPDELNASVDQYIHKLMEKIDREFTVASLLAEFV